MAESYFELLKHPEWQKKRLRIMERDDFQCRECSDKGTTLNVHHSYYTKGAKPWEYPDESLRTLCEVCHEERHALLASLKAVTGEIDAFDVSQVIGFAKAHLLIENTKHQGDRASVLVANYAEAYGIGCALGIHTRWPGDTEPFEEIQRRCTFDGTINFEVLCDIAIDFENKSSVSAAPDHEWERSSVRA
jgi:hypothetical protein